MVIKYIILYLHSKTNKMKNLTIKRQKTIETIETNVVYDLPAFFKRDDNEVFAVYTEDKVVRVQYFELTRACGISVRNIDRFENEIAESIEITEEDFLTYYNGAISIAEEASNLVLHRLKNDELQDRESEMTQIEMEVNEVKEDFELNN